MWSPNSQRGVSNRLWTVGMSDHFWPNIRPNIRANIRPIVRQNVRRYVRLNDRRNVWPDIRLIVRAIVRPVHCICTRFMHHSYQKRILLINPLTKKYEKLKNHLLTWSFWFVWVSSPSPLSVSRPHPIIKGKSEIFSSFFRTRFRASYITKGVKKTVGAKVPPA